MTDIRIVNTADLRGTVMQWLLTDVTTAMLDDREELATAIRLALGSDAMSRADEILPDPDSTDRRGWWGDLDAELIWDGWPLGCKNWLLLRAKINPAYSSEGATVERARIYTLQALQPFVDKRVCTRVEVSAERQGKERINVFAVIYRGPLPEIELRFQILWGDLDNAE
jgi:phage gp46-like protein